MNVRCYDMPDVDGFEESLESEVVIWEYNWRKKVRFAWQMEIDLKLLDIFSV